MGLSHAIAGAAETGTLFLVSGAENPSTINFLPEHHAIVILASDIVGSYEEGWAKLRVALWHAAICRARSISSAARPAPPISNKLL